MRPTAKARGPTPVVTLGRYETLRLKHSDQVARSSTYGRYLSRRAAALAGREVSMSIEMRPPRPPASLRRASSTGRRQTPGLPPADEQEEKLEKMHKVKFPTLRLQVATPNPLTPHAEQAEDDERAVGPPRGRPRSAPQDGSESLSGGLPGDSTLGGDRLGAAPPSEGPGVSAPSQDHEEDPPQDK